MNRNANIRNSGRLDLKALLLLCISEPEEESDQGSFE